ncbi:hypothetical protein CROQUDRAFT_650396, partial [Cronartium quercuum f. sp. fusiforme G11]
MPPNILHPTSTHPDLSLLSPLRTCPPSSPSVFSSSYSSSEGHSIAHPLLFLETLDRTPPPRFIWLRRQSTPSNEVNCSASTIVAAPDSPSNRTNPHEVDQLLTRELTSRKSSWV